MNPHDTTMMPSVEERFARLVQHARLVVWEFDPANKQFTYVSPHAQTILGYPLSQWQRPEFWYDHLHPDDRERAHAFSRDHVARGVDHEFEYRMIRADGGVVWFRDLTSVIKQGEKVVSLHGLLIDISEQRAAAQALRESEARYRAIVEDQTELIYRFLPDGTLTFVNDAYCRYFGYERDTLIGRSLFSIAPPANAERVKAMIARLTPQQPAEMMETNSPGPDGELRWRHWTNRALFDEAGRIREIQAAGHDITDRKRAEEALERSNELQRLLLSELDHRVRNNLASLAALIDIAARDSHSVTEFADSVRGRVQAMSIVHTLLSREHWGSVKLRQLVESLVPSGRQACAQMSGPDAVVFPRQATALGMVLQELFANCQKHGSLMAEGGRVEIKWAFESAGLQDRDEQHEPALLRLHWSERGGPAINTPVREGLGASLVRGLVNAEMRGEARLEFPPDGAEHEFLLRLETHSPIVPSM